jgi:uncharacterized protein YbaP (TraB family)
VRRITLFSFAFALVAGWITPVAEAATGCVWKVTSPNGGTLFLGGSWHALRSSDYPLPAPYQKAFEASDRLAFEVSPKDLHTASDYMETVGEYRKGDSLKNHVDPRTYAYLRRFFGLLQVSEDKYSKYKPWFISMALESPDRHGLSNELGIEAFFEKKAKASAKPIVGLESAREHVEVFSGLSDRGSEALLLLTFIPADKNSPDFDRLMSAWRRGDADFLADSTRAGFRDFPAMADRLLSNRNRNWIPQLEGYMRSGKTYFVVVGSAHMGGQEGVLALLRARGYKIEQLT